MYLICASVLDCVFYFCHAPSCIYVFIFLSFILFNKLSLTYIKYFTQTFLFIDLEILFYFYFYYNTKKIRFLTKSTKIVIFQNLGEGSHVSSPIDVHGLHIRLNMNVVMYDLKYLFCYVSTSRKTFPGGGFKSPTPWVQPWLYHGVRSRKRKKCT